MIEDTRMSKTEKGEASEVEAPLIGPVSSDIEKSEDEEDLLSLIKDFFNSVPPKGSIGEEILCYFRTKRRWSLVPSVLLVLFVAAICICGVVQIFRGDTTGGVTLLGYFPVALGAFLAGKVS